MTTEEENGYIFDFEKLEVYKKGLMLSKKVFDVSKKFSKDVQYSIGDQFRRASLSIVNNIAEGSGKIYKKEKAQFYKYAINSARECIPIIFIAKTTQQISNDEYADFRREITAICKILGRMIINIELREK